MGRGLFEERNVLNEAALESQDADDERHVWLDVPHRRLRAKDGDG